jgi:hypothetical protein
MTQFACGYCGSNQVVERSGGTVSLKPVVEAVARVQIGTDKTAAELAIPRLQQELSRLQSRRQEYEQTARRNIIEVRSNSESSRYGSAASRGILSCLVLTIFASVTGAASEVGKLRDIIALLVGATGGAIVFFLSLKKSVPSESARKNFARLEQRNSFSTR